MTSVLILGQSYLMEVDIQRGLAIFWKDRRIPPMIGRMKPNPDFPVLVHPYLLKLDALGACAAELWTAQAVLQPIQFCRAGS